MMTSSNGNIFRVTVPLYGLFTGPRWIPRTKASEAELYVFFDLRRNKRLSKQSWGWWFETPWRLSPNHCNVFAEKRSSIDRLQQIFPHVSTGHILHITHYPKLFTASWENGLLCTAFRLLWFQLIPAAVTYVSSRAMSFTVTYFNFRFRWFRFQWPTFTFVSGMSLFSSFFILLLILVQSSPPTSASISRLGKMWRSAHNSKLGKAIWTYP